MGYTSIHQFPIHHINDQFYCRRTDYWIFQIEIWPIFINFGTLVVHFEFRILVVCSEFWISVVCLEFWILVLEHKFLVSIPFSIMDPMVKILVQIGSSPFLVWINVFQILVSTIKSWILVPSSDSWILVPSNRKWIFLACTLCIF
jgi:hypothetical protein